jgi:hypothetical protein
MEKGAADVAPRGERRAVVSAVHERDEGLEDHDDPAAFRAPGPVTVAAALYRSQSGIG